MNLVYLIGPATPYPGSLTKIGTTTDLVKRLRTFQTGSPVKLSVLWAVPGDRETELWLHDHFSAERKHGEWFDLGPDPERAVQNALGPYMTHLIQSKGLTFPLIVGDEQYQAVDEDELTEEPDSQGLLTTSEAATLAGVPTSTIRTWKQRGQLIPVDDGPEILYRRVSVLARMKETSK